VTSWRGAEKFDSLLVRLLLGRERCSQELARNKRITQLVELGSGARANRESFLGGWRRRRNTPFQERRNFRDKPICRVTHTFHSLVCESFEPDSRWTKRASLVSMFLANSMSEVGTLRFRSSSSKGFGHLDIVLQIDIETLGLKEDLNLP
jgi:hypothetical protein